MEALKREAEGFYKGKGGSMVSYVSRDFGPMKSCHVTLEVGSSTKVSHLNPSCQLHWIDYTGDVGPLVLQ